MQDTSIPVDGGRISVWYRPALPGKPTVTLVHGLTGTSRWWLPVISQLPSDLGVIAPDLRGRGRSWETSGPFDLSSLAPDISACLNHFEVPETVIVGYSMGAWLASLYASTRSNRISGVVLADGGVPLDIDREADPDELLQKALGPSLARYDLLFDTPEQYLDFWRDHPAFGDRWSPQLDTVFSYDIGISDAGVSCRGNTDAIRAGGADLLFDDQSNKAVNELTAPTKLLIVDHGMLDQLGGFIPRDSANEAAARNPNVSVTRLTGLNHYTLVLGSGAFAVAGTIVSML